MKPYPLLLSCSFLVACAPSSAAPVGRGQDADPIAAPMLVTRVEVEALPEARVTAPHRLVVHEWGTFTSRADATGNLLTWRASDRGEPLPKFVFESWVAPNKRQVQGTVRMETPALYFYANTRTQASARVEFPGGFLTEWFPSAEHDDNNKRAALSWPSFQIVPGPDPDYPINGDSYYYAARETDATPLEVPGPAGIEHEKLLFYGGVGSFALPLQALRIHRKISLTPMSELAGVIVFRRQGDELGFQVIETLAGPLQLDLPALDNHLEALTDHVARLLVAQGLYKREATAMIETWQSLWFEDGLRVLYMVPRELTDQTLPLTLKPAPDELVRVLVGRLDLG